MIENRLEINIKSLIVNWTNDEKNHDILVPYCLKPSLTLYSLAQKMISNHKELDKYNIKWKW